MRADQLSCFSPGTPTRIRRSPEISAAFAVPPQVRLGAAACDLLYVRRRRPTKAQVVSRQMTWPRWGGCSPCRRRSRWRDQSTCGWISAPRQPGRGEGRRVPERGGVFGGEDSTSRVGAEAARDLGHSGTGILLLPASGGSIPERLSRLLV
jgi:hypothetical protein